MRPGIPILYNGNADEPAAMLLSVVGVAESVSANVRSDTDLQNMVAEEQPTQALERQRDIFEAVMSNGPFAGSDVGDLEDFTGEGENSPKRPRHMEIHKIKICYYCDLPIT